MLHLSITWKAGIQAREHTAGVVEGMGRWRASSHREDAGGLTATKGPHWLKKNLIFRHQVHEADWEMVVASSEHFAQELPHAEIESHLSSWVSSGHCFLFWLILEAGQPSGKGSCALTPKDAVMPALTKDRCEHITLAAWEQEQTGRRGGVSQQQCGVGPEAQLLPSDNPKQAFRYTPWILSPQPFLQLSSDLLMSPTLCD